MGNAISTITLGLQVLKGLAARTLFGWNPIAWQGDTENEADDLSIPSFQKDANLMAELKKSAFSKANVSQLSDDQIVKICRQLEFWYSERGGNLKSQSNFSEMVKLAEDLVDQSTWYKKDTSSIVKVPKVRFGKTEVQIPVVTCGGMRLQNTWLPDNMPLLVIPKRKTVLASTAQRNVKECIRVCMKLGINHFETARMYGTSEYQMVEALYELMEEGEFKREDFILQTKILGMKGKDFEKSFNLSWANIEEKLGYIDLLSLHGISEKSNEVMESLAIAERLKQEGKVRHVGFSTHGTSEQIMDLINTERFEYVNLHYHYFGRSYHGTGTSDTLGGQGNLACVKRALELDMGVFQISPFDKGGKLYRPSKDCAVTVGKELSPMEFAALYAWKKVGMHTSSLGIARPSDLDEVMSAARTMALGQKGGKDLDTLLDKTIDRLDRRFEEKVGKEWAEKGLMNIPSCYDESSHGVAIGHMLWLHDLLISYGMYEFCKNRYDSLEMIKWNEKKPFEENIKNYGMGNAGRAFDDSVDLSRALEKHYNPELVVKKLKEVHNWLSKGQIPYSDEDLEGLGFARGYNLTTWMEVPGEIDSTAIPKIFLGALTGGRMGLVTGPGYSFRREAASLRSCF